MPHQDFESHPFRVGLARRRRRGSIRPRIVVRSSRTLGQCRIQASSWMRRPKRDRQPGQFFNLLCPSPTRASYGCAAAKRLPDRPRARPPRVPLQVRRPRHPRARDARARRRSQHGRTARGRLHHRPELEAHRGARPRRRPRHLGADLPARRREWRRRDRHPERAQREIRDGGRAVPAGRRRHRGARLGRHQRGRERGIDAAQARSPSGAPTPSTPAAQSGCSS